MKKIAVLLALLVGLALAGGCASNTLTAPVTGPDGKVVYGADNKPLTLSGNLSDSAMFHWAQTEALKYRKPIAELSFPEGGTMPAGASFTVWGPNGMTQPVQYKEPWVPVAQSALNVALPLGLGWLWSGALSDARGNTYRDSFNDNSGVQSGSGRVTGGVMTNTVSGEGNSASGSANPSDTSSTRSTDGGTTIGFGGGAN